MQYKIESCTKDLRPLRGSQDQETLYTGIRIGTTWYNLKGDHRNLYNKVVDLEIKGNLATFTNPQTPPAPAQQPPTPPPPHSANGHTPKWATRDEFINQQRLHGYMSMSCLNCGYPTERDVAWCEACLGETSESRLSELEKDKKP